MTRYADKPHLSLPFGCKSGLVSAILRHRRVILVGMIHIMDLQQIDGISPHPFQAPLNLRLGSGVIPLCRLGGQKKLLPPMGNGLSDNFLTVAVSGRRIHIINP
ncbi:hypothetical protein D3C81_1501180 [compost metagenome]